MSYRALWRWLRRLVAAPITPGAKRSVVTLFVVMVALFGVNLLFTARQVTGSERQWCSALVLITAHPVPRPTDPAANPSREQSYILYSDFLHLRHHFGCG